MFPANDGLWTVYIKTALIRNVTPCWVDIVGDNSNPACYYYLNDVAVTPREIAFRMRLNGSPLSNNPLKYELKEFVWGVQIVDMYNSVKFSVYVNATTDNYALEVWDSTNTKIYSTPIILNSPETVNDNVRVRSAGTVFPCTGPTIPDEDFFLDFRVPVSAFTGFDFDTDTYKLCYFTSTQENVINKDYECGGLINKPEGAVLCVSKHIESGPSIICACSTAIWVLHVVIENCGDVDLTNVVLTDTINSEIASNADIVLMPNVGPVLVGNQITWNIGTLMKGEKQTLGIEITGYFDTPGHKIFDEGEVDCDELDPIPFKDVGIDVIKSTDKLIVEKSIIEGPQKVSLCDIETWKLRIYLKNTCEADLAALSVFDEINCSFSLEDSIVLTPSKGIAFADGKKIYWDIELLRADEEATLYITLKGFFAKEGLNIFNKGYVYSDCIGEFPFEDEGIEVFAPEITDIIEVYGKIQDLKTGQLLEDVLATIYDNRCNIMRVETFDKRYNISLKAGTYIIKFSKEGYVDKILIVVLQSDMDIYFDIKMLKRSAVVCSADIANKDLYLSIIKERVDADAVFSKSTCINTKAKIENLCDVVENIEANTACNSKLLIDFTIEKNIVYKLNNEKNLKYDDYNFSVYIPICRNIDGCSFVYNYKYSGNYYCKDDNIVYNIAYIKFNGYFVCDKDVLVNGADE
ncbi:hypothetical protein FDN13_08855 [Caloramator sp. E03]|uniref:hypothetical protein n=1 Tax=Caloramator sp. E03 TaxID=2576307 RepID=UPI00111039E1|nr:hypothetical protein [Caloramator sp. E03]QCX33794.1 hypothetical protein FDN13_08855 [Caloramator sp. E03]